MTWGGHVVGKTGWALLEGPDVQASDAPWSVAHPSLEQPLKHPWFLEG